MFSWIKKKPAAKMITEFKSLPDASEELFPHVSFAVGGLTEIGFSRRHPHLLLLVSSSGRGIIDCRAAEKIARDYEEYGGWYDPCNLKCWGFGPLADENIDISGLCGGGLPLYRSNGELLVCIPSEWPEVMLFWCPTGKDVLYKNYRQGCLKLTSDHILCCGFSWCGEFIVSATSSDITLWRHI